MTCKKDHVPFNGTPEQEKALKEVIAQLKDTKGALMPIMQHAQDIYGYLPIEVQTVICKRRDRDSPGKKSTVFRTLLFPVCPAAKRQISDFCLPWHRLLRERLWRDFKQIRRASGNYQRRMYTGWTLFFRLLPLCRRLRPCASHDGQR